MLLIDKGSVNNILSKLNSTTLTSTSFLVKSSYTSNKAVSINK